MKLKLLLFGITKDIIGRSSYEIEVEEGAVVRDLKATLIAQYPKLTDLASLMVAVNNQYAADEVTLQHSDEVALIPPVSGG